MTRGSFFVEEILQSQVRTGYVRWFPGEDKYYGPVVDPSRPGMMLNRRNRYLRATASIFPDMFLLTLPVQA